MVFAAVWPVIEFGIYYGIKVLKRFIDRGFSCNKDKTKCKTIQQYVDIHAGVDYLIHFKYSAIMNVCFITFLYGLAMPLLFPIALLFYIVMYTVERLCITYYYKKPPMYDEKLNAAALSTLKWAPVFMMAFGFWIMGNQQIFSNYIAHT